MNDHFVAGPKLSPAMRWLLIACGPMNVGGAICFAPPGSLARRALGLPEADPFYLWILSSWILAFGIAYFHQGWAGQGNRTVLALGTWGKLVFASQLIIWGAHSPWPLLLWSAAGPDLACGVLFGWWLWRHRH